VSEKGGVGSCQRCAVFLPDSYFPFSPFDMLNSSIVSILPFMYVNNNCVITLKSCVYVVNEKWVRPFLLDRQKRCIV
jgi:hypothetical protein